MYSCFVVARLDKQSLYRFFSKCSLLLLQTLHTIWSALLLWPVFASVQFVIFAESLARFGFCGLSASLCSACSSSVARACELVAHCVPVINAFAEQFWYRKLIWKQYVAYELLCAYKYAYKHTHTLAYSCRCHTLCRAFLSHILLQSLLMLLLLVAVVIFAVVATTTALFASVCLCFVIIDDVRYVARWQHSHAHTVAVTFACNKARIYFYVLICGVLVVDQALYWMTSTLHKLADIHTDININTRWVCVLLLVTSIVGRKFSELIKLTMSK